MNNHTGDRPSIFPESILFAPIRSERPNAYGLDIMTKDCPFCVGNELMTPPEIALKGLKKSSNIRVVPNKYPIVSEIPSTSSGEGENDEIWTGYHEVIIEGQSHDASLLEMDSDCLSDVVLAWSERVNLHSLMPEVKEIIFFRNEGSKAGATLKHPHSQLVSLTQTTERLEKQRQIAYAFYRKKGICVYCELLASAQAENRVICQTQTFIAFIPEVCRFGGELMIMPRNHAVSFEILPSQVKEFSELLQDVLARIKIVWNNPDYNLLLCSAAKKGLNSDQELSLHWFFELIPRVGVMAGFEIATAMQVQSASGLKYASMYRSARIK